MHCSNCGDSYYVQLDYNPTARSHLTPSRRYLPIPEYAVPEYASPNLIIVCFFGNWRGRRYVFLQMRCMIDVWLTRLLAPASLVRPNVNQAEQLSADRCRLPLALHVPRSAQNVLHTSVGQCLPAILILLRERLRSRAAGAAASPTSASSARLLRAQVNAAWAVCSRVQTRGLARHVADLEPVLRAGQRFTESDRAGD